LSRIQFCDELAEFMPSTRSGAADTANVVLKVKVGVIDPDRVMQPEGRLQAALAPHGNPVDRILDILQVCFPTPPLRIGRGVEYADF
jgi:hypothetical protein